MAQETGYLIGAGDGDIEVDFTVCDDCGKEIEEDQIIKDQLWSWKEFRYIKDNELCLECYLNRNGEKPVCAKCGADSEEEWLYEKDGTILCSECAPKDWKMLKCSQCGETSEYEVLYEGDYKNKYLCAECYATEILIVKPS